MTQPEDSLQAHLEDRLRFETMLADLSARFVGLPSVTLDNEIEDAQRCICQSLGLDRSTLTLFDGPEVNPRITHSWAIEGFNPNPLMPIGELFPWAVQMILNGQMLRFTSVDELPAEARIDKESFRQIGQKSNVTFPLIASGKVLGALSFGALKAERQWPKDLVGRLRLVSEMFAGALARRRAEDELVKSCAEIKQLKDHLLEENVLLRQDLHLPLATSQIIGRSDLLRHALVMAEQVAVTDSTVLVLGETGTGKELIASVIHEQSARRDRPMIRINCAAIPTTLIESELFGREKGAYTGALTRQIGRFESADHSTLFLDEIGELPPEVQIKLLRFLQERQIERLGSTKSIRLDVRIIAATNCDLQKAIHEGRFREDLYYRLSVFPITVPPLRERREDIPFLVQTFAGQFANAMGKTITSISKTSLEALQRYGWPGNVRELRNVVERAVILAKGSKLTIIVPNPATSNTTRLLTLNDVEREHILHVLEQTGWRVQGKGGAAEILGLNRSTLESRMAKLGILRPQLQRRYLDK
jgi:formate hydrogenlyase transcriptional activator